MISAVENGYADISVSPSSTNDKVVISDMVVSLTLGAAHGADDTCYLKLAYDSTFVPSRVFIGSSSTACTNM
jgi:hypothetical protein